MLNSGPLWISEFMADNTKTLQDQDLKWSDWIEIHNPTASTVALDGWYLTDSASNLTQWQFPDITSNPDVTLASGAYLVVFASGNDRRIDPIGGGPAAEFHTNFKLSAGGEYLALVQPDGQTIATSFGTQFPNQYADVSYGPSSDGLTQGYLVPATPGRAPESDPTPSLVVINEIMYHPGSGDPGTTGYTPENTAEEYVELYNGASGAVSLKDWELDRWSFSTQPVSHVSQITHSGTTATVAMTLHGYSTGDWVEILGADQPQYNGVFQVSYLSPNLFTYTMSSTPTSDPVGTITAQKGVRQVTSITRQDYTATVILANHGFANGDTILISGAGEDAYNGAFTISGVTANTFNYTLSNIPTASATGTVLAQKAAQKFPDVSLPAGGYLVVAGDVTTFRAKYPSVTNVVAAWTPKLSDSAETLALRNAQGVLVSKVAYADEGDFATRSRGQQLVSSITRSGTIATVTLPYHSYANNNVIRISGASDPLYNGEFQITVTGRDTFTYTSTLLANAASLALGTITAQYRDYNHYGWEWYSPSDGHGKSLELINPQMKVNQGENWGASTVDGGTPGAANSIAAGNIAPLITNVEQDVVIPHSTDAVTVTAHVTDEVTTGVTADLFYRVDSRAADGLGPDQSVPSPKSITSITRSSSTATVTTSGNHGFSSGSTVTISGADQAEYNGTFVISGASGTTFTYAVTGTPASPATGTTITGVSVKTVSGLGTAVAVSNGSVTSITRSTTTATVTLNGHGFSTGNSIRISGAGQTEYNGTFTITYVDANKFTYTVAGTQATPATGTIAAAKAVTGIARSGGTATVTLSGHGFASGNMVAISGADQPEYNGVFLITYISSSTFSYPISTSAAASATGTISVSRAGIARSGSTATVTLTNHGFVTGQTVFISGATQSEYNGYFPVTYVNSSTFTYPVSDTAASPATGFLSVQPTSLSTKTTVTSSKNVSSDGTTATVTSITRSGSTATVSLTNHGFVNGQTALIAGATQTDYNGYYPITYVDANTFSYPVSNSPASPATTSTTITARSTGLVSTIKSPVTALKPVATPGATLTPTSIIRAGYVVTVTLASHGFVNGQTVLISGASQPEYNGYFVIHYVSSSSFTYNLTTNTAVSPATGTLGAQSVGLGTKVTLTGILRNSNTATATLANHGYVNGQTIILSGASQGEYNGTFVISNVTTNTFDFNVSVAGVTPATTTTTFSAQPYGVVRSGSTAIVAIPAHGYSVGDVVMISGAEQPEYNGMFTVTSATTNTFTYTVAGTPASPGTGTITSMLARVTRSGPTVTMTLPAHGYAVGQTIVISGATQPEYNGAFEITNVTATTFQYTISGTPASPATGSISAQPYGISRSGSTAIVSAVNHGYATGDLVFINGAGQSQYNGTFPITVLSSNTFSYTMSGTPTAPATGTVTAQSARVTRSGTTATVTLPNHGYADGETILVSGAGQSEYNGTFTITVVDANRFSYTVAGTQATPATGSISVQPYTISLNGSTAIVSMASHGYANGAMIQISGADQPEYNGVYLINVVSNNTFTYQVSDTPASPATGAIWASYVPVVRAGYTVTVPLASHGFIVGQTVKISGATLSQYNGTFAITAVTANTFDYVIGSFPASPATGALIVQTCGIGRTGGTAMVYSPGHGYANGDTIVIEGANQADYNGTFVISNVTANTFTYPVSSTAVSPATGWMSLSRPWTQVTMYDDGLHGDQAAGDGIFGATVPAQANGAIVEFYVRASDSGGRARTWPGAAAFSGEQRANLLYQVDDSYNSAAAWVPGSAASYRLIMTAAERDELAYIGYHGGDSNSNAAMNGTFITIDGSGMETEYRANIRNRGHGTRTSTTGANNYMISVPHDRSWNGYESTIVNFTNPYSEVMGSTLWQAAGLAGPDQWSIQVRIDGVNKAPSGSTNGMYGYYTGKEEYSKDFTARAFPDDADGNLYSVYRDLGPGDLRYLGTSPDSYRLSYFKQTNAVEDDWSDLIHMTDVLNSAPAATFLQDVSQVIDVNQFMRYLALDILSGNGETGLTLGFGDDYGMYRGAKDTRFKLIPWDLDTLFSRAQGYSIFTDYMKVTGIARLLTNPATLQIYYQQLLDLINTVYAPANFNPLVDQILGGWVPASTITNIKSYVATRTANVLTQIPRSFTVTCTLSTVGGYPQTTLSAVPLSGTADVSTTRSVLVGGQAAQWNATSGAWTLGTMASSTAVSFQEGTASYVGTADTYIRSGAPTTSYAAATALNVDSSDGLGVAQALLRFSSIFGTGAGQIPPGATITSATLVLNVTDAGDPISLYRMLVPWNDTDAWGAAGLGGNGIQADGVEAAATPDATFTPSSITKYTVDVTAAIRAWLADTSQNYGWALLPGGTGGVDLSSREYATATDRPLLNVTYTTGGSSGGATLVAGINRVLVQTFDGESGSGNKLKETYVDVWRDTGVSVTVPGGNITANTIWDPANGVYHVTGDLVVDAGATLTVLPGTTVFFDTDVGLTVTGRLVADGTPASLIRFTRTPGGGIADGLHFLNTMDDNRISYAVVEYGEGLYTTGSDRALIGLDGANLTLDHVTLDHARYRRIRTVDSSLIIRNSTFTDIQDPGVGPLANNYSEQIWGKNALTGGHIIIDNNWFGITKGHNDIIDVDGGLAVNGDPVPQILNNVFTGGGDDACDLEGDFVIAGNLFMHFNKDSYQTTETGEGNSISSGDSHLVGHTYWILGNVFYDDAHAELIKGNSFSYFLNNTVINANKEVFIFNVPGDSNAPGRGAYIDGTIFWNTPKMFEQLISSTDLVVNRSIIAAEWQSYGVGNIYEDPRLVNPAGLNFTLRPGSPALGTGPNGIDMGAKVTIGASISGEPAATTRLTTATLTVGGPGVSSYMYRVNNGAWSGETPVATPITLTGLAAGTYTVYVEGKDPSGTWQSVPTASKSWTVNTALRRVQINEVLAINNTAVDHEGTYPDLIELVNSGAVSVDLSGMAISDSPTNTTKYVFPAGTVLGAGEYLVVFADDANTATSGLHLGFKLDGDRGAIYLFDTVANGSALLDSVVYGKQVANLSIGRVGHDASWTLTQPTFGTANLAVRTGDPSTLKLNEWFTNGDVRLTNDFVELYNPDPLPVPLAGLSLTDNPISQPGKSVLPALSYVAGAGYVSYTADGDPGQGSSHLSFQLSANKEWIALQDASLKVIDRIVHYDQTIDISQGRSPDGGPSPYTFFALPTPGVSNAVTSSLTDLTAGLRITEIMYNPSGDGDLEFIELVNVGSTTLNLAGVRLGDAVSFTFPAALLAPGQYAVVARNMAKFAEYYGPGINLLGQYDNKLSDGGDSILLQLPAPYDAAILRFNFDDAWYPTTDGGGYALAIRNPAALADSWGDQASWQAGTVLGGSPGRADAGTIAADVVINEVLTHTDEPLSDSIELYNRTDAAVDISGWYLSDTGGTLQKFRIPDGTLLAAHGYIVFTQGHWVSHVLVFAASEFGVGATGFALSSYEGDQVWLSAADSTGNILRVVDYVDFPAMANGESLGRWPNGSGNLYPLENRTLVAPNNDNSSGGNGPRVGPVLISEILYAPTALTPAETAAGFSNVDDMEYIEIHNPTGSAIELAHWHLDKGVNFDFAAGTWLAAHGTLVVVPFDPAGATMLQAFRTRYGMSNSVTVVGPFIGHLSDTGEKLLLQDSDEPPLEAPTFWPPLLEDEVVYDSTWGAGGNGFSLQRVSAASWGLNAASWTAAAPVPGRFSLASLAASMLAVAPNPRNSALSQVQIMFNEPVTGFDRGDLRLTYNGGGNLLTGSQTLTTADNITWTLENLTGLTGQAGTYVVTLVAAGSGIQDAESYALPGDATTTWTMDNQPPTALIAAVVPSPRTSAVAQVQIVFSETIREALDGFDLADLRLTRDGGANLLTASQTLGTADFITWTLGNLAGLTAVDGSYQLSLVAAGSGIVDLAGNSLVAGSNAGWVMDTSAPTVQIVAVGPSPINSAVSQLQIVFSEAIVGLDVADLRLTRDGGANLLTGSQTFNTSDQITWVLGGLSGLTGVSGSYAVTLVASGSGVQDLAGNLLVAGASTGWVADLIAPTATIASVSPDPRDTSVDQLAITFSEPVQGFGLAKLSLSLNGAANLLTLSQTLNTSDNIHWTLGNLSGLTGTQGRYSLTLSAAGITDSAGNVLASGASTSWALTLANLDADGNGAADALTDGILILRYLFDSNGAWNYSDALGSGATRTSRAAIKTFLDSGRTTALDADGNGAPDALTDGILILRYLFDPNGAWNYSDALGSGATRTARSTIRAYLDSYNPAVALPGLQAAPTAAGTIVESAAAPTEDARVAAFEPTVLTTVATTYVTALDPVADAAVTVGAPAPAPVANASLSGPVLKCVPLLGTSSAGAREETLLLRSSGTPSDAVKLAAARRVPSDAQFGAGRTAEQVLSFHAPQVAEPRALDAILQRWNWTPDYEPLVGPTDRWPAIRKAANDSAAADDLFAEDRPDWIFNSPGDLP